MLHCCVLAVRSCGRPVSVRYVQRDCVSEALAIGLPGRQAGRHARSERFTPSPSLKRLFMIYFQMWVLPPVIRSHWQSLLSKSIFILSDAHVHGAALMHVTVVFSLSGIFGTVFQFALGRYTLFTIPWKKGTPVQLFNGWQQWTKHWCLMASKCPASKIE